MDKQLAYGRMHAAYASAEHGRECGAQAEAQVAGEQGSIYRYGLASGKIHIQALEHGTI